MASTPGSQVFVSFNTGDPITTLADTGNGVWQGIWTPGAITSNAIAQFAVWAQEDGSLVGKQTTLSGSIAPPAPPPTPPVLAADTQSIALIATQGDAAAVQQA